MLDLVVSTPALPGNENLESRMPHKNHRQQGQIHTSDPYLSRCFTSQLLLAQDPGSTSEIINTTDRETYGDPTHPIRFRIGNGGAGYTGILKLLAETYIAEHGQDFRIAWVSNHSRHSQIALLAGVVHIALTYEPENEEISIQEGWAKRACRAFNDHFILVGPAGVDLRERSIEVAFRAIAMSQADGTDQRFLFHSRGDGSATFAKEQMLWQIAGINFEGASDWIETFRLVPYDALVKAEVEGAFLLTDRSTYLTAKRDGVISSLRVHSEGGRDLLNPCSAIVCSSELIARLGVAESHAAARSFARWLAGDRAQRLVARYGLDWPLEQPLFTAGDRDEFDHHDGLVGRC